MSTIDQCSVCAWCHQPVVWAIEGALHHKGGCVDPTLQLWESRYGNPLERRPNAPPKARPQRTIDWTLVEAWIVRCRLDRERRNRRRDAYDPRIDYPERYMHDGVWLV